MVRTRVVAIAAAALAAAGMRAEPPAVQIQEIVTITSDEGRFFHGWPTVAARRNGELIVVWSGGRDAHSCPFGRLESMVSRDGGATWSAPRVLFDSPIDDRDGGIVETARGTLLATTFSALGFTDPANRTRYARDPERWRRHELPGTPEEWAGEAGPRILRSEDGGRNWSAAEKIPVSSPHGPIVLRDGRLLYPGVEGVGRGRFYRPGERKTGVWESADDGRTWRLLSLIPARRGENADDYHELHGVEAADGTVVVLIRSHADPARRRMLQTESKDGGRTWTEPRDPGIPGYPPHLLRLPDDRLLLSYDNRHPPYGVQARLSADHGRTWSEPIVITRQEKKLDQGYPSTARLPDGSFVTIWYEAPATGGRAVLRQARWRLVSTP